MTLFAFIAILVAGFIGAGMVRGSDLKGVAIVVVPALFVLGAMGIAYMLGVDPVKLMAWAGIAAIAAIAWAALSPKKPDQPPGGEG